MRVKSRVTVFSLLLVIALVLSAFQVIAAQSSASTAAQAGVTVVPTSAGSKTATGPALRADQIIGSQVVNMAGRSLGRIENLLINDGTGCVDYAVLSLGSFAGLGEKLFPVPFGVLQWAPGDQVFAINTVQSAISGAPSIDRYNWTDEMQHPTWAGGSQSFWSQYGVGAAATVCGEAARAAAGMTGETGAVTNATPAASATAVGTETPASATPSASDMVTATAAATATAPVATTQPLSSTAANGATGGPTMVQVKLVEWAIQMPASLPAGPTTFVVTNAGTTVHNFAIEGNGVQERFPRNLRPGETGTISLNLPAGAYNVYCPVDAHLERGMRLALQVGGAGAASATAVAPLTVTVASGTAAPAVTAAATGTITSAGALTGTPSAGATVTTTIGATTGTATATMSGAGSSGPAATATVTATNSGMLIRATHLGDFSAVTSDGQTLGLVSGLLVDMSAGRVAYVLVGMNGQTTSGGATGTATAPAAGSTITATGASTVTVAPATTPVMTTTAAPGPGTMVTNTGGLTLTATPAPGVTPGTVTAMTRTGTLAGAAGGTSQPAANGTAQRLLAVPWNALRVDTAGQRVIVNATRSQLSNAPTFAPEDFTSLSGITWDQQLRGFWLSLGATATPAATASVSGGTAAATAPSATGAPEATGTPVTGETGTPVAGATMTGTAAITATTVVTTVAGSPAPGATVTGTLTAGTPPAGLPGVAGGTGITTTSSGLVMQATKIIGSDVRSASGGSLGSIVDLLVDIGPTIAAPAGSGGPAATGAAGATSTAATAMPAATGEVTTTTSLGALSGSRGAGLTGPANGRIIYAVVGFGGFLGINQQRVAVPWSAFTYDQGQNAFVVNFDAKTLQSAPGFDANNLPKDTTNPNWDAAIRSYWSGHGIEVNR